MQQSLIVQASRIHSMFPSQNTCNITHWNNTRQEQQDANTTNRVRNQPNGSPSPPSPPFGLPFGLPERKGRRTRAICSTSGPAIPLHHLIALSNTTPAPSCFYEKTMLCRSRFLTVHSGHSSRFPSAGYIQPSADPMNHSVSAILYQHSLCLSSRCSSTKAVSKCQGIYPPSIVRLQGQRFPQCPLHHCTYKLK